VPEDRIKELAKAVRELEGPVYIHCHHGKHRSPAASAVACVAAGLIAPQSALAILEAAGTSSADRPLFVVSRSDTVCGFVVLWTVITQKLQCTAKTSR
jgi:hypothetical protein